MSGRVVRGAALCLALASAAVIMSGATARTPQQRSGGATGINPAVIFSKNCATCHGKDGRARTFKAKFNHARDLTDARWQESVTDEHISNTITRGHERMPAFGKKLTPEQIASLVSYVRALKQ